MRKFLTTATVCFVLIFIFLAGVFRSPELAFSRLRLPLAIAFGVCWIPAIVSALYRIRFVFNLDSEHFWEKKRESATGELVSLRSELSQPGGNLQEISEKAISLLSGLSDELKDTYYSPIRDDMFWSGKPGDALYQRTMDLVFGYLDVHQDNIHALQVLEALHAAVLGTAPGWMLSEIEELIGKLRDNPSPHI